MAHIAGGTAPTSVSTAASAVTSSSATLNGTINPQGLATKYYFTFGPTTAYGHTTPTTSAGGGSTNVAASTLITGLLPSTAYHFQLIATNARGTSRSHDLSLTTAPAGQPSGIPGKWSPVFSDDFNGSQLDTSKWSTGWFGSGVTRWVNPLEQNCYGPSQVRVASGALTLTASLQSTFCGMAEPYLSGLISTRGKFAFTNGAFEARIWMPANSSGIADWPGFWADGKNWPQDGEIDVVEGLAGRPCYHFHYTGGGPGGCSSGAGVGAGWHTYAADWEPGSITFYYDGQQVGIQRVGITQAPMYLILNLAVSNAITNAPAPASMQIDYVRAWKQSS